MHSKKLVASLVFVATALCGVAAPARAALVFDFEAAAIGAFRNWTPPGHTEDKPFHQKDSDSGPPANDENPPADYSAGSPPGESFVIETQESAPPLRETDQVAAVPEPASAALLGVGLAGLALNRRRRSVR